MNDAATAAVFTVLGLSFECVFVFLLGPVYLLGLVILCNITFLCFWSSVPVQSIA